MIQESLIARSTLLSVDSKVSTQQGSILQADVQHASIYDLGTQQEAYCTDVGITYPN